MPIVNHKRAAPPLLLVKAKRWTALKGQLDLTRSVNLLLRSTHHRPKTILSDILNKAAHRYKEKLRIPVMLVHSIRSVSNRHIVRRYGTSPTLLRQLLPSRNHIKAL